MSDEDITGDDWRDQAEAVYQALLARVGEGAPERRLDATRRAVELLIAKLDRREAAAATLLPPRLVARESTAPPAVRTG